jgi:hypothetical protein
MMNMPLIRILTFSHFPRTVIFKDTLHGTETKHETLPGSLYCMSKKSQGAYRHRIEKDENFSGTRYSITFRCIHYKYLNSTCVLGDSNTEQLKFGDERGTFGKSTPGMRLKALYVEDVNASDCISYKNVVLMVGTNNLKSKDIKNTMDVRGLVNKYTQKIREIRQLNGRCHVFVVPVIPTQFEHINCKIRDFNRIVTTELPRIFSRLSIVSGVGELADRNRGGVLDGRFSRKQDPSGLHVNNIGISIIVSCIKAAIFSTKSKNQGKSRVVSNIPYSAIAAAGASTHATSRLSHGG